LPAPATLWTQTSWPPSRPRSMTALRIFFREVGLNAYAASVKIFAVKPR
jgi:hypothetical protein